MNNSDILVALSLWLATFIFLFQADPALLQVKVRRGEGIAFGVIWAVIIALVNHEAFDRNHFHFYFSVRGFFLTPNEWALVLFLALFVIICDRVFRQKIFNLNPEVLINAVYRYRLGKNFEKLMDLLVMIVKIKDFGDRYGQQLDDMVFNDHHLIEQLCSENPDLVIDFTDGYTAASINRGDYFYYVLSGLFSDQSNGIYSEIRRYRQEGVKEPFLMSWGYATNDIEYKPGHDYRTNERVIRWLTGLLGFPPHLKDDIRYILNKLAPASTLDNERLYSRNEIETVLSRDPVYNAIQLFRILIMELSFSYKNLHQVIDRYVIMLYSAWDFVADRTELKTDGIQLDNDSYTINEYLLKYIFEAYCSIFVLNCIVLDVVDDDHTPAWVIQQMTNKLNALWKSEKVSMATKMYYMQSLIELYYELPEYLPADKVVNAGSSILYQLKNNSLERNPFGNPGINRQIFDEVCSAYEFYRQNNKPGNEHRAQELYEYFLPYSEQWKDRIVDF